MVYGIILIGCRKPDSGKIPKYYFNQITSVPPILVIYGKPSFRAKVQRIQIDEETKFKNTNGYVITLERVDGERDIFGDVNVPFDQIASLKKLEVGRVYLFPECLTNEVNPTRQP